MTEQQDQLASQLKELSATHNAIADACASFINNRPGLKTSEFLMTSLAILVGGGLAGLGSYIKDEALLGQGLDLIQWAVAAYAVSRGISKIGPKS